jgi:N-acetylglucosaminyl-diphospho-decaprenol L-rhamnosyltransferase
LAKISIIIVSYNRPDLLEACLDAVSTGTSSAHEIIVVDNASTEGSARVVCRRFASVRLIENSYNSGYAVAINQGDRVASGDYLMLLNPDTVPLPGAIDHLAEFIDAQPKAGMCGPKNVDKHGISKGVNG